MKREFKISYFVATLVLIAFVNCTRKNQPADQKAPNTDGNEVVLTAKQVQNADLQVDTLQRRTLSSVLHVNGKIDLPPQNLVSVSVPYGGYLYKTTVMPGSVIRKGEVLAILEDPKYIELQQDYLTTKVKCELAEIEFRRQKSLNENKANSDRVFQQAKAEFMSQKIMLNALSEKLKCINIDPRKLNENNLSKEVKLFAPFNGFVSKINVMVGKYVNPSDVLFELVNPANVVLNLNLFEKDLTQIATGQKLVAYNNHNPSKKYDCVIDLISKDLSSNHTASAYCKFKNPDTELIPGMYMNANIDIQCENRFAVKEEAVITYDKRNYLFIETNQNGYKMVEVETGVHENGWIEIKNGSHLEQKRVVMKGAYTLLMALKNRSEE